MTFTVLRCVGYPEDWFEKLLYYKKHPKPMQYPRTIGKRRALATVRGSLKKWAKTGKGKVNVMDDFSDAESDEIAEESDSGDDSDYLDGSRYIVELPKRPAAKSNARRAYNSSTSFVFSVWNRRPMMPSRHEFLRKP
ncbi:hypothetical protein B0H19DRAFT_1263970 [Mycena capillaripes]|nr:hypothetical protein B0H19DRAFT_1263970 [Mycena capillaripes]